MDYPSARPNFFLSKLIFFGHTQNKILINEIAQRANFRILSKLNIYLSKQMDMA